MSRSQAKKLVAGLHRFQTVILDFAGVDTIGQAFTDEIFRVYARHNPEMEILAINSNLQITEKINAAKADCGRPDRIVRTARGITPSGADFEEFSDIRLPMLLVPATCNAAPRPAQPIIRLTKMVNGFLMFETIFAAN